jgi:hypothetical protein
MGYDFDVAFLLEDLPPISKSPACGSMACRTSSFLNDVMTVMGFIAFEGFRAYKRHRYDGRN